LLEYSSDIAYKQSGGRHHRYPELPGFGKPVECLVEQANKSYKHGRFYNSGHEGSENRWGAIVHVGCPEMKGRSRYLKCHAEKQEQHTHEWQNCRSSRGQVHFRYIESTHGTINQRDAHE